MDACMCQLGALGSLREIIADARQSTIVHHRRSTNNPAFRLSSITGLLVSLTIVCFNGHLHPSSCIFSTSYPAASPADDHPSRSTWVSYDRPPFWRHCPSLSLRTAPTQALPTRSTTLALFLARPLRQSTLHHGARAWATGKVLMPKLETLFLSSLSSRKST